MRLPPSRAVPLAAFAAVLACVLASCQTLPVKAVAADYVEIGNAYFELGKFDKAGAAYAKALSYDPLSVTASFNLARALLEAGKADEALAALDELLAKDPENAIILKAKAYALYKADRREEAITVYEKVMALLPYDVDCWYNYGILLAAADRDDEAGPILSKVVEIKPDDADALLASARVELRSGDKELAYARYLAYLDKKPGAHDVSVELAEAYRAARLFAKAMEIYKKLADADPKDALSRFELGYLELVAAEDAEAGLTDITKALDAGFAVLPQAKERVAALLAEEGLSELEALKALFQAKGLIGEAPPPPETPASQETSASQETPASQESPAAQETPATTESGPEGGAE